MGRARGGAPWPFGISPIATLENTATGHDRTYGIKWLSCAAKRQSDTTPRPRGAGEVRKPPPALTAPPGRAVQEVGPEAGRAAEGGPPRWRPRLQVRPLPPAGGRARSHALPRIHFIPYARTESVPLFLKRQCDRTLAGGRCATCVRQLTRRGAGGAGGGAGRRPGRLHRRALPLPPGRGPPPPGRRPTPMVISDYHFTVQLNRFIPGSLSYSVASFSKVSIGFIPTHAQPSHGLAHPRPSLAAARTVTW